MKNLRKILENSDAFRYFTQYMTIFTHWIADNYEDIFKIKKDVIPGYTFLTEDSGEIQVGHYIGVKRRNRKTIFLDPYDKYQISGTHGFCHVFTAIMLKNKTHKLRASNTTAVTWDEPSWKELVNNSIEACKYALKEIKTSKVKLSRETKLAAYNLFDARDKRDWKFTDYIGITGGALLDAVDSYINKSDTYQYYSLWLCYELSFVEEDNADDKRVLYGFIEKKIKEVL